jgi:nitroimidazol reductase NimA-like FMN-containing flavoprotein (pyridoxamine 5'-phosphate oxidase superfamily)
MEAATSMQHEIRRGAPSARVSLGRYPERGEYEFKTISAILDEALVCHVGFSAEGQPFVIPTTYARIGADLYIHGSPVARWLRNAREGVPLCVTVTLLDGLVLARSAFRHSMNYRSVVIVGRAVEVEDRDEKMAAFRALVEHVARGRWDDGIRQPSESEIRATMVLKIGLGEASAKHRTGPPNDLEDDMAREVWAGVIPLSLQPGAAIEAPRLRTEVHAPRYVTDYRRE